MQRAAFVKHAVHVKCVCAVDLVRPLVVYRAAQVYNRDPAACAVFMQAVVTRHKLPSFDLNDESE